MNERRKILKTEEKDDNKFYNLSYDRVFKTIVQRTPRLLELILSDILDEEVEIINFVPTELPIKNKKSKVNILDILVKTKENKLINVELNSNFDKTTKERNLVYYTSLYSQKKLRGKDVDEELEVVHVDINVFGSINEEAKRIYYVQDDNNIRYSETFKIIAVNIAKYKDVWYHRNILGDKSHIYLVMLGANEEELESLSKHDKLIKGVNEEVEKLNKDEVFIREISLEEEAKIRERMRIKEAKKEGLAEGIEKGVEQVAREMLENNESLDKISKYTNLSKEQINNLKNN